MSVEAKCEVKEEEEEVREKPAGQSKRKREEESAVRFQCGRCGLTEFCHFFGREPYFCAGAVKFAEDTFVLKDPFSAETFDVSGRRRVGFLILGGTCYVAHCSNGDGVCVDCSVFYKHRFCLDCAASNMNAFPDEMQSKIAKKLEAEAKEKEKEIGGVKAGGKKAK